MRACVSGWSEHLCVDGETGLPLRRTVLCADGAKTAECRRFLSRCMHYFMLMVQYCHKGGGGVH